MSTGIATNRLLASQQISSVTTMSNQAKISKGASTSASSAPKSPDSGVSPHAQVSQAVFQPGDYFSTRRNSSNPTNNGNQPGVKFAPTPTTGRSAQIYDQNSANFHRGSVASSASPGTSSQVLSEQTGTAGSRRVSEGSSIGQAGEPLSRKSSVASVSFRPPQDPSLPQGVQRKTDGQRLRASSPEPVK